MASTDTDSIYSPRARNIQREYQLWAQAHQSIKNSQAQEGRNYVTHAKNLLPMLEGLAELHPVAKAVVTGFKAVVMYEADRKENDARIAVLFVSQSDMMCTLLDFNQLSARRKARLESDYDDEGLHSDTMLSDTLLRVDQEIKACGNSMDTYYKEARFVKFWKSQEWKDRIIGHTTKLDNLRALLQQSLSIQSASDTNNMVEKMNVLLLRLFSPKADWEKAVVTKTRRLGKPKDSKDSMDLINDIPTLQSLVAIAKDPSLDSKTTEGDNSKSSFKTLPTQIEQLKKELNLTLDEICGQNKEMFERKLEYHTRTLQEAIENSAQYVIRSLAGPYDRLHNEDLKILWKEMNWIFCIDNKLFTSALFEYYLDQFSTMRPSSKALNMGHEGDDGVLQLLAENEAEMAQENLTKVTHLSRLGILNHVNAWTLAPIAKYGHRISSAIDRDESGFIRISEANTFTEQMPKGWSLPQWCAYAAFGEAYESRIYRKRISNIVAGMMEMQRKVLSLNRGLVLLAVSDIVPFFQLMAWEPTTFDDSITEIPDELFSLVHDKIKQQDDVWRQKLASFNWTVEDEATLQLLYGKNEPEMYMLQLSVLLLEYAYDVLQACCKKIIDLSEISNILSPLCFLQKHCMNHVGSLQTQFKKEKKPADYLKTFSGGIWHAIHYLLLDLDNSNHKNTEDLLEKLKNSGIPIPFKPEDFNDKFFTDEIVIQHFPLRPLADGNLPYLEFKPWEDYIQSIPEDEIPDRIPDSWIEPSDEEYDVRYELIEFPLTTRGCDRCGKCPIPEHHYVCTICTDFDMCSECSQLPAEEHTVKDHDFSHPMMRFALHTVPIQRDWLALEAKVAIHQMQEDMINVWGHGLAFISEDADDPSPEKTSSFTCSNCQTMIPFDSATTFYKCMRRSCSNDFHICDSCIQEQITNEDPEAHQWWHPVLVLRRSLLVETDGDSSDSSSDSESSVEQRDPGSDHTINIGNRISEVEAKLDINNSMLQEALNSILSVEQKVRVAKNDDDEPPIVTQEIEMRMSQLEDKMDGMMMELRNFLASFTQRSGYSDY